MLTKFEKGIHVLNVTHYNVATGSNKTNYSRLFFKNWLRTGQLPQMLERFELKMTVIMISSVTDCKSKVKWKSLFSFRQNFQLLFFQLYRFFLSNE
jgi:hypothetical protein